MIAQYPGAISAALCEEIIAHFEADPARKPSAMQYNGQTIVASGRSGLQLAINTKQAQWKAVFRAVLPAMHETLSQYAAAHPGLKALIKAGGLMASIPMIERVEPGQGFDWHCDQMADTSNRVVAGLLYLRTITAGGETEFFHQAERVQPEAGKIVLFPPFWTHFHRGVTPTAESKYVLSWFWLYNKTAPAP